MHPTAGEMVAATHGRSLWVLDVTRAAADEGEYPEGGGHAVSSRQPAMRWRREPTRGTPYGAGNHQFVGQNPPPGAQIYYSLTKKADKVQLKIVDYAGQTVRELPAKSEAGLHRVPWDLAEHGANARTRPESGSWTWTEPRPGRHVSRRPHGGRQGTHAGTARGK